MLRPPLLLLLPLLLVSSSPTPMSTFGAARSGVAISGTSETTLLSHTTSAGGGMLTYIRVASDEFLWPNYDLARVRIYVDGEASPSVDYRLGLADSGDLVPFGVGMVGNTADNGGVYLTLRVPFSTSVVVNATQSPLDLGTHSISFVVRGVVGPASLFSFHGLPAASGGLYSTARLRSATLDGETFAPYAPVPLLSSARAGALAFVGLQLSSTNTSYTSGPVTALVDGAAAPVPLSHSLPSFFAQDEGQGTGKYVVALGGVTALAPVLGAQIIAFRVFDDSADPVLWSSSMELRWAVGEAGAAGGGPGPTVVSATVFWYEFE
jgi:hypothetical protein